MIAGGIGVTPYISIMKNIVLRSPTRFAGRDTDSKRMLRARKAFFIWIVRSLDDCNWMMTALRDIEEKDDTKLISMTIYVTLSSSDKATKSILEMVSLRDIYNLKRVQLVLERPNQVDIIGQQAAVCERGESFGVFCCAGQAVLSNVETAFLRAKRDRKKSTRKGLAPDIPMFLHTESFS